MAKQFFAESELTGLHPDANGVMPPVAYSLRGPVPQMFLVTVSRDAKHVGPTVRTVPMTPLSWVPYTMAVTVSLEDSVVVENLRQPGAQCVLAEPTRHMLRQLTICSRRLPRGLSEANVARFKLMRSLYIDVPGIADCPLNMECTVEHLETYHDHLIAFVRVVGGSIDDSVLFWERQQIVNLFPTNDVDTIVDGQGNVVKRVAIMGDLFLCPTFPCAPKQGWYGTFDQWMKELREEDYLSRQEYETIIAWHARWQEILAQPASEERSRLQRQLTDVCRLIAQERWDDVHSLLAD